MEQFRRLAIKVKGIDSEGSGCLVQGQNKVYVLTALHCLIKDKSKRNLNGEKERIELINFEEKKLEIIEIYIPDGDDFDFAVIEVIKNSDYDLVPVIAPISGMKHKFFGFPEYLDRDSNTGDSLDGTISEVVDNYEIILQHQILGDLDKDSLGNTRGYSGSGIYIQIDSQFILVGLVRALRGKGEHGKLVGINIVAINEFLKSKNLPSLDLLEQLSFDTYFEQIVGDVKDAKTSILRKAYKDNFIDINPKYIVELLKEKIIIPYSSNYSVSKTEIWKGWVKLLLYLSIYQKVKIDRSNVHKYIFLNNQSDADNILYYTEETRIQKVVRSLYESAYEDLFHNGKVFINSNYLEYKKILNSNTVKKVVRDISETVHEFYQRDIDITDPYESKSFSIIPMDYLSSEIEDMFLQCEIEKLLPKEIEDRCTVLIEKLFTDFKKLSECEEENHAQRV